MAAQASDFIKTHAPGVLLAAVIAAAAVLAEPLMRRTTGGFALPAMVMACFSTRLHHIPAFSPALRGA
jgi:hypothetical protein